MPISFLKKFTDKLKKDKENVPSHGQDIRKEPFVVPRVGEIRGYIKQTVDEYGQPSYEELSDIVLKPDNYYAIYIVPDEITDVGEYVYNGLIRVKPLGSNIEKVNSLIFTCMKNCRDMVMQGDKLEIGINELNSYRFNPVAKGGKRRLRTIRKHRSRKSRRAKRTRTIKTRK
jgi:hypothetical protein